MIVTRYLHLLPVIQERIELAKLDCIVLGLGPTAWLYNWMPPELFAGKRLFGAHDAERITRVHDLVILDQPVNELNEDSDRHHKILESRPDRLWIHHENSARWLDLLDPEVKKVATLVRFKVWPGRATSGNEPFALGDPPQTYAVSPTGCTTLAWAQGCRRIGVLGADMIAGHHHSAAYAHQVDCFFTRICKQADAAGGLILNLSPITSLQRFAATSQAMFVRKLRGEPVPKVRDYFHNDVAGVSA